MRTTQCSVAISTLTRFRTDLLTAPKGVPDFPPLGETFRQSRNLALNYRRVISRTSSTNHHRFARFKFFFTFGESNPDFPNIEPYDFADI
jgi:hypothetical protein